MPGLIVGLIAGSCLFARIPTEPFRKAVVILVIATAVVSMGQGIERLLA